MPPSPAPRPVVPLVTSGHGAHDPGAAPARSGGTHLGRAVSAHGRHSAPYQPNQFAACLGEPPQAGPGTAENSLYASLPTSGQTRTSSLPGSTASGRGNRSRARSRRGSQKLPRGQFTTRPAPAPPGEPPPQARDGGRAGRHLPGGERSSPALAGLPGLRRAADERRAPPSRAPGRAALRLPAARGEPRAAPGSAIFLRPAAPTDSVRRFDPLRGAPRPPHRRTARPAAPDSARRGGAGLGAEAAAWCRSAAVPAPPGAAAAAAAAAPPRRDGGLWRCGAAGGEELRVSLGEPCLCSALRWGSYIGGLAMGSCLISEEAGNWRDVFLFSYNHRRARV